MKDDKFCIKIAFNLTMSATKNFNLGNRFVHVKKVQNLTTFLTI